MKARKIIICFDGTGNEVGDFQTNILKLYNALQENDAQIKHYVAGVGTLSQPRLFDWRIVQKARVVAGLAFGLGLEDDVLNAYRFLCRTYKTRAMKNADWSYAQQLKRQITGKKQTRTRPLPQEDQIYIFGFSRGAYAARILAGFIHNFGLVEPDKLHLITGAFRAYRAVTDFDQGEPHPVVFKQLKRYEETLRPETSIPIRALCLFDTVSSLVDFRNPIRNFRKYYSPMALRQHANVVTNPSVRIVLHALAVDERRSMFRPMFWDEGEDYYGNRFRHDSQKRRQYVQQRWFAGYHSDIGGSPRERQSGIGKLTLLWMLDELERLEIAANREDAALDPPDPARDLLPHPHAGLVLKRGRRAIRLEGRDRSKLSLDGKPYAQPRAMAETHSSMSLSWFPLEVLPKSIKRRTWAARRPWLGLWYLPLQEPRHIPDHHKIDPSVYTRMKGWRFYRPENVHPKPRG